MTSVSKPYEITNKPIADAACGKKRCKGMLWRQQLSRLEEGLGHEGFACDMCGRRVKYVPKERS